MRVVFALPCPDTLAPQRRLTDLKAAANSLPTISRWLDKSCQTGSEAFVYCMIRNKQTSTKGVGEPPSAMFRKASMPMDAHGKDRCSGIKPQCSSQTFSEATKKLEGGRQGRSPAAARSGWLYGAHGVERNSNRRAGEGYEFGVDEFKKIEIGHAVHDM